ncbi:MAG: tetratricopeptide repeat protein [Chroococcidiopsidaceae cyanobacterium CP_BM_ER_R8_30]|nr:tetratricopeptide repeat protein [Chroococcidiopsidaceae cyanobacterium CP_BM_ER_R8_30]
MSQSRNRWLISIVLILAVVGFVGFSMAPLLNASYRHQTLPPTVNTTAKTNLADKARGYELVLQREPENQTALQGLVQARIQLQEIKGAIAPMEKLVALNPDRMEYKLLLAQLKQFDGDPDGAIQVYRSMLATKPGDMGALRGAVSLLLQQNRSEEAVNLLQDTLKTAKQQDKTQPATVDVAAVQLLLAQVYVTQKHDDQAITIYDRMIEQNKQDFRPVLAKAVVLRQEGKTEQAKSLFESAATIAPEQYKEEIKHLAAEKPVAENSSTTPEKPVAEIPPKPEKPPVAEPKVQGNSTSTDEK